MQSQISEEENSEKFMKSLKMFSWLPLVVSSFLISGTFSPSSWFWLSSYSSILLPGSCAICWQRKKDFTVSHCCPHRYFSVCSRNTAPFQGAAFGTSPTGKSNRTSVGTEMYEEIKVLTTRPCHGRQGRGILFSTVPQSTYKSKARILHRLSSPTPLACNTVRKKEGPRIPESA